MTKFIHLTFGLLILWRLELELVGAASIVKVAGPEEEKEALRMWAEMCSEGKPGSGEMDGKLVYCAEAEGDEVQMEHSINLDKMLKRKDQVILVQPPANFYNHKISVEGFEEGKTTVFIKPSEGGQIFRLDGSNPTGTGDKGTEDRSLISGSERKGNADAGGNERDSEAPAQPQTTVSDTANRNAENPVTSSATTASSIEIQPLVKVDAEQPSVQFTKITADIENQTPVKIADQGDDGRDVPVQVSLFDSQSESGSSSGKGGNPNTESEPTKNSPTNLDGRTKVAESETVAATNLPMVNSDADPESKPLPSAEGSSTTLSDEGARNNNQRVVITVTKETESTVTSFSDHSQPASFGSEGQAVPVNADNNEVVDGILDRSANENVEVKEEGKLKRRKNKKRRRGPSIARQASNTAGVVVMAENLRERHLATYCDFSNPDAIAMSCVYMQMMPNDEMNYEIMHMMRQDLEKLKV